MIKRISSIYLLAALFGAAVAQVPQQGATGFGSEYQFIPDIQQGVSPSAGEAEPVIPDPTVPVEPKRSEIDQARKTGKDVFGQWLFSGRFAQQSFTGFNPDYQISVGDLIDLKMWGAYNFSALLTVDAQGNIFLPQVGPVSVVNVRNSSLNSRVLGRVKKVYRENVGVYASLAAAQPVKVFLSGHVVNPGLYGAAASDSVLHYLDLAGGIEPKSGSYLDIRQIRNGKLRKSINLYDFLVNGKLPLLQFQDGDTIFVGPRQGAVKVGGLVNVPAEFEVGRSVRLGELFDIAGVAEKATHVQIRKQTENGSTTIAYMPLSDDARAEIVPAGSSIELTSDLRPESIIVLIDGEHNSQKQVALPYQSTLADLLTQIETSELSNIEGLRLFRSSVAERQKILIEEMLQKLEQAVLSARSGTVEEATLRAKDAQLVLKFIERAKSIKPKGQLILRDSAIFDQLYLEDGDRFVIPRKESTVAVHGEVYFPNAFTFNRRLDIHDYVELAGGLTQQGNRDRILLVRANGEILDSDKGWGGPDVLAGDEILVLPKVDAKGFQYGKDIVQIIYQIAVAAGVVVRL